MKELSHAAGRSFTQRTVRCIDGFLCMQLQSGSGTHIDRSPGEPWKINDFDGTEL
jgi:hypothetical protein